MPTPHDYPQIKVCCRVKVSPEIALKVNIFLIHPLLCLSSSIVRFIMSAFVYTAGIWCSIQSENVGSEEFWNCLQVWWKFLLLIQFCWLAASESRQYYLLPFWQWSQALCQFASYRRKYLCVAGRSMKYHPDANTAIS